MILARKNSPLTHRPVPKKYPTCVLVATVSMAARAASRSPGLGGEVSDPRETEHGVSYKVPETQSSGSEQEDTGGDARGRSEGWTRHHETEGDRSKDQCPAGRSIPRNVDAVVKPEQERTDRDCYGRQDPVRVAGGNYRSRDGERCDQLNDCGD